jgi:hypothetical protein
LRRKIPRIPGIEANRAMKHRSWTTPASRFAPPVKKNFRATLVQRWQPPPKAPAQRPTPRKEDPNEQATA